MRCYSSYIVTRSDEFKSVMEWVELKSVKSHISSGEMGGFLTDSREFR